MGNLYLRKKSKRESTKHRVKVERKVRDHNRKLKKEAKKGTGKRKAKGKDPGIPSGIPFRDDVLQEVEAAKERREEEIRQKKEARKKAKEKFLNEKRDLAGIMQDAKSRQEAYDKIHSDKTTEGNEETPLKSQKTGNPENSRKTFFKEFKKVVDAADVVLEVLDARDPLGSRCEEVEEAVRMSPGNKRLVLVLNKIDLVPKENVELWLKHLRKELPAVAFKASTQQQKANLTRTKVSFAKASKELMRSSNCLGADVLMKLLGNYCRNTEMSINVGVVGYPNTGKSSIINSLKRARACNVGAIPGVTKVMQTVQLDKHIRLLDSPGVVMVNSPSETAAVLRNVVKLETLHDPIPGVEAILSRCQKSQMMMHYKLPNYKTTTEFLTYLAARLGKLKKKGVPDINRAARRLLQDWNGGVITYYTTPPEDRTSTHHIEASIVTEWGKEFNIDEIMQEESSIIKGLKPSSDKHIHISPLNPLKGVLTEEGDTQAQENDVDDDEILDDDDDDNDDDDEEEMEDDEEEEELKGVTVDLEVKSDTKKPAKNGEAVKDLSYRHKGLKPAATLETVGGLITKKSRKMAEKKEKKRKKRAGALAGKLSDAMTSAFASFGAGDGESYSFDADFK